MDRPENFERLPEYAVYRPEGRRAFAEWVELLCVAITYAREQGIDKLLVEASRITGIEDVRAEDRFTLGDRAARAAQAAVKTAIVVNESLLDPGRFGMTVARNRGLFVNAFSAEPEALRWLLDPNAE